ncbi:MAG: quinolinate synthase NadA [Methanobacteriota archaeon]
MDVEELVKEITSLKKERNAIILSHNYQLPPVQDVADFVGDSYGLSKKAQESDADVIVFCGVKFMAETAAILSPDKLVIMPDIYAGCPLAEMISVAKLRELKAAHPDAASVAYVNTNADVKAEVDVCCTSSNAIKVVESLDAQEIIFVPDKYLANYVATQVDKKIIPSEGYCSTHVKILAEDILREKKAHPKACVMVHPECRAEVIELADKVLSTGGMVENARDSSATEFIVGTEVGMLHRLKKDNPEKFFYPASELAVCPNMKRTTLDKVAWSLRELRTVVSIPEDIRLRARKSIERMLEII